MDRLLTMRVFQAVADEGGFAAAARALDLSAVAVTRLVADLENHVGTRLLQRTTRRVSMTDAGEAYLARVRQILDDVDEAFAAAQAHTSEMAGVLRVSAAPVLAVHILAPLVAEFRELHPQVVFDIHVDSSPDLTIGDYDITLMSVNAGYNGNVIARPIISSSGVLCASPQYLKRNGTPQHPDELPQHQCLLLRRADLRAGLMRLFDPSHGDRIVEVQVQPVCIANEQVEAVVGRGAHGQGVEKDLRIVPSEQVLCHQFAA